MKYSHSNLPPFNTLDLDGKTSRGSRELKVREKYNYVQEKRGEKTLGDQI